MSEMELISDDRAARILSRSVLHHGQRTVARDIMAQTYGGTTGGSQALVSYQLGNGITVIKNPDPILNLVANTDVAEYERVESEPAVGNAKKHLLTAVFGDGEEICVGRSHSDLAYRLRDFVVAAIENIQRWDIVRKKIADGYFWGYRPFSLIWSPDVRIDGKPAYSIVGVREQPPCEYLFTPEWHLVYRGDYRNSVPQVLTIGDGWRYWMVSRGGANYSPYGEASYRQLYLTIYIKQRFLEMFAQGMERSMGMVKVKETNLSTPGREGSIDKPTMDALVDEVNTLLEILAKNNVLIERAGVTLEFVKDIAFAEGWQSALEYLDMKITQAIVGQNLSSQVDAKGSRAAATTHTEVLDDYARDLADHVTGVVNEELIPRLLIPNFGLVQKADMPRYRLGVQDDINLEAVGKLFEMGAVLDGAAIGRAFGVPVLSKDEEKRKDVIALEKPEPPPALDPGANPLRKGPLPTRPMADRNQDVKVQNRRTERDAVDDEASDALARHYSALVRSVVEGNRSFS